MEWELFIRIQDEKLEKKRFQDVSRQFWLRYRVKILAVGDNHEPLEHTLQNKLFLVLAHSALLAPADAAAALGGLKAEWAKNTDFFLFLCKL